MVRKQKRNASLLIKKKGTKHIKKTHNFNDSINSNINTLNDCDDVSTTVLDDGSSSRSKISSNNIDVSTKVIDAVDSTTNRISDYIATSTDDDNEEEPPKVVQDFNLEIKLLRKMKLESHRWSVFNLFVFKYDGLNPPDHLDLYQYWSGRGGVASKVKKDLHLPRTYCVKERMLPIFERILECFKLGEKFHPSSVDSRGGNRPLTIRMDSFEAQIIADGIESGLSIRRVWENVNCHKRENNDELVSESAIYYVLRKMKPKIVNIRKRKQGSSDPDSNWAQARCAWTRQLLVRFDRVEREPKHGPVEKRFDSDLQGKLALDQIVWWDETHRKCLIGGQNPSKCIQIKFPRNKDGKVDIENGEYSAERKTILNVKYEKECRLGLGVAMVTPLGPDAPPLSPVGRRCLPYDYSSKVMISVDDYKKRMKTEFQRVKSLKGHNGYWVSCSRDKDIKYYDDDPVIKLKGVGKKASKQLQEIGVKTIGELKRIDNPHKLDNLPKSLTQMKLTKFWNEAQSASNECAPKSIDHRVCSNPYESKFGDDWEQHLQASPTFSHSSYICNYIEHMMNESERVMKGTIHEKTWMVYHDALSIMTSKSTKQWMKEKGYLDRWILPSSDLYDNLPSEARRFYEGKPVGNSPEFMPLDTHLNQDLHSSHDLHATITQNEADNDPKKFDGSTPKRLSESYHRLFHPQSGVAPSSDRIIQDVQRVLVSLETVLEAEGCIIDENKARGGRRFEKLDNINDKNSNTWGGKRTKSTQAEYLHSLSNSDSRLHSDAKAIILKNSTNSSANHHEELTAIVR